MATTLRDLEAAIVRVLNPRGRIVGAGFLVGDREVVSCAHVVDRALGPPSDSDQGQDQEVRLDFPMVAPGRAVAARVAVWQPPLGDGSGDVAGLQLREPPPAGVRAVRLINGDELWDHRFRVLGFPAEHGDGVWATGRLRGRQATGWVQMDGVTSTGYPIEQGFSGAAVWDEELDAVVGMAVAAERRPDVRVAYLIPTGTLVETWPDLADQMLPPCPYLGLLAFQEQDATRFFGRAELAAKLVDQLERQALVAVVGPSGSGKSSLVFAGAVPELRRRWEGWVVASLRPARGASAQTALAAALLPLLEPAMTEADRLLEVPKLAAALDQGGLLPVTERALQQARARRLLLIVDQAEEMYTQERAVGSAFTELLVQAAAAQRGRARPAVTVALTLRADFLDRVLEHADLDQVLQESIVPVGRMTPAQLREAVTGPVADLARYEPGLVERIIKDVGEEPGNLPLLEFTLTLLWEQQHDATLTHTAYERLGGVNAALAGEAERVYLDKLSAAEQGAARRLLVQLVRPGDTTAPTRRVAYRAELDDAQWQVAQLLASARLVVTARDLAGRETVELTHEALISNWARLRGWVDEDREFRAWQERLRGAIDQWEQSRRNKGALLRGAPLAVAGRWLVQRPQDLGPAERAFIRISRTQQGRAFRLLQVLSGGLAVLLVVAVVLGFLTGRQLHREREQNRLATSAYLAAQAGASLDHDPQLSMLLSVAAYRIQPGEAAANSLLGQAGHRRALLGWLRGHNGPVQTVAFDPHSLYSPGGPHGGLLASGGADKTVRLWDVRHHRLVAALTGHTGAVHGVAFSPNGRLLASAGADGTVRLWDPVQQIPTGILTGHRGEVNSVAFSPNGRLLASAGADGTVRLWDPTRRTPTPATLTGHKGPVWTLAFSPDGRLLASGGADRTVRLWDLTRLPAAPTATILRGHTDTVRSVAFSPDGRLLASAGKDNAIRLWDVARHRLRITLPGHPGGTLSVAFRPGGRLLASGGVDKTIRLWNVAHFAPVANQRPIVTLQGHTDFVFAVAFSPDGQTLASGGADKADRALLVWDPTAGTLIGHTAGVWSVAASDDGRLLVSGGVDATVRLWAPGGDAPLATLSGHTKPVLTVAISPDGQTVASGAKDTTVRLWDVARHRLRTVLTGHSDWVTGVAFSPDGRVLASVSRDGTVRLWELARLAAPPAILPRHGNGLWSLAFSPDGRTLATGGVDGRVRLWDTARRTLLAALAPHADIVRGVAFSPNGQLLASGSQDGTVRLWDAHRHIQLDTLVGHTDWVNAVAFSPDSRTVGSASRDKTVRLWDVTSPTHHSLLATLTDHAAPVLGLAFSPDGRTLASADFDGTVTIRRVDIPALPQYLCGLVGRALTKPEWAQFLPGHAPLAVCG